MVLSKAFPASDARTCEQKDLAIWFALDFRLLTTATQWRVGGAANTSLLMTDRHAIRLNSREAIEKALQGVRAMGNRLSEGWVLTLTRKRSSVQNALMWQWLTLISKQLLWHGKHWTPEQWKDCLMHAFKGGEFMPGIDGGFVPIGRATSALGVSEFSDFLASIEAFAAREGVELGDNNPPSA